MGFRLKMSLVDNKTEALWHMFMTRRKEIANTLNQDLISLQVYAPDYFTKIFNPARNFEKWALAEVIDFEQVPAGMETFILEGGLYAVFDYKGRSREPSVFEYIFGTWLPVSEYMLDHRPHFEAIGAKYKNNDPDSEEEIWIPVKPRST